MFECQIILPNAENYFKIFNIQHLQKRTNDKGTINYSAPIAIKSHQTLGALLAFTKAFGKVDRLIHGLPTATPRNTAQCIDSIPLDSIRMLSKVGKAYHVFQDNLP